MIEIQWLGHACFRIRMKEGILLTDPFGPEVGLNLGRPTAHIVTVSHNEPDHNNIAAVRGLRNEPFVISGPGEYEVGGIFVLGIRTYRDAHRGRYRGKNTVYLIESSEGTLCHLGDLGHPLGDEELGEIGNVDVLMVPVGGKHSLTGVQAAEVVGQIEPRIVIPMHYHTPGNRLRLDSVEPFLQAMGVKPVEPIEALRIGAGEMPGAEEETRLVVLKPGG